MKILVYILLFYLAYRFFVQPALEGPKDDDQASSKKKGAEDNVIDIDYEEID